MDTIAVDLSTKHGEPTLDVWTDGNLIFSPRGIYEFFFTPLGVAQIGDADRTPWISERNFESDFSCTACIIHGTYYWNANSIACLANA